MFLKNKKQRGEDPVVREQPAVSAVAEKKAPQALSEEGLFDIAFENYRQAHPESGMKRRDFRRNVWNSDSVAEFLSDSQYRKYQEYRGIVAPADDQETEAIPAMDEPCAEDELHIDPFAGLVGDAAEELPVQETDQEELPIDDADEGQGISELEPAFDESFLRDLPMADDEPVGEMVSDTGAGEEMDPMDDIFGELPEPEDPQIMETEPEESGLDGQEEESLLDEAYLPEEETEASEPEEDTVDEQAGDQEGAAEESDAPMPEPEEERPCDPIRDETLTTPAEEPAQPAFTGIFAADGIMEKLRRSMYLNETDTSLDDEILSLSRREVFEQLVRLEGCVKKAGAIGDLAELVFGAQEGVPVRHAPVSEERLLELLGNAAGAIGYLMHFDCVSEEQWNRAIAEHLGLSEQERALGLVPVQPLNQEYVIKCYDMGMDDLICVRGDYTKICRAVFLYEQAYTTLEARPLMQFLESVGLNCRTATEEDAAADIEIVKGRVYLV